MDGMGAPYHAVKNEVKLMALPAVANPDEKT
jgi:hypothetical protein